MDHHEHEEHDALRRMERKLDALLLLGEKLMSASDDILAFAQTVNTQLDAVQATLDADTQFDVQIAAEMDALIAGGSGTLSPEATAALQSISDRITASVAPQQAQSAALAAIVAKVPPAVASVK